MVFIIDGFLEVAIESWPEWDSKPPRLHSGQMFQPTELSGHEFNSHSEPTLYSYSNFIFCSVFRFHFGHCLRQSPRLRGWGIPKAILERSDLEKNQ